MPRPRLSRGGDEGPLISIFSRERPLHNMRRWPSPSIASRDSPVPSGLSPSGGDLREGARRQARERPQGAALYSAAPGNQPSLGMTSVVRRRTRVLRDSAGPVM